MNSGKYLLALAACLILPRLAAAQDAAALRISQKEAVKEFPGLAQPGSSFNKRFLERVRSLKTGSDSVLLRDDWPLLIAKQVALELGVDPVPQVPVPGIATANATPAPTATPWVPLGTALDRPGPATDDALTAQHARDAATKPLAAAADDLEPAKKYIIYGYVQQTSDQGVLVQAEKPRVFGYPYPIGAVWVVGKHSMVGSLLKIVAVKTGTHVLDASTTVDEYTAQ